MKQMCLAVVVIICFDKTTDDEYFFFGNERVEIEIEKLLGFKSFVMI